MVILYLLQTKRTEKKQQNNRISSHRKRKIDSLRLKCIRKQSIRTNEKKNNNQTSIRKGTEELNGNRDLSALKLIAYSIQHLTLKAFRCKPSLIKNETSFPNIPFP